MAGDLASPFPEGFEEDTRRRKDEGRNMEQPDRGLPDEKQGDDGNPRHVPLQRHRAGAVFCALAGDRASSMRARNSWTMSTKPLCMPKSRFAEKSRGVSLPETHPRRY